MREEIISGKAVIQRLNSLLELNELTYRKGFSFGWELVPEFVTGRDYPIIMPKSPINMNDDLLLTLPFLFKEIDVQIRGGKTNEKIIIIVQYSYRHYSGSNGYSQTLYSEDNGLNFEFW